MEFRSDSLGLAGAVTAIFRDLIHDRLGLTFGPAQLEQVGDRLAPLLAARGFTAFMDYYYFLKYSGDAEEWGRVMDALAVPETYFWREVDQIRAVAETVVPDLIARGGGDPLRIWSAPCASGEEPLTIAMMLDELGWFGRARIEIAGSDASPAAIAKARAGVYGPRSFRALPERLRDRYFTMTGEREWTVVPELHRRVTYDVVNLADTPAVEAHARVPIVFCRNVFIYFSDQRIRTTVDTLARVMREPAHLCVGAAESLFRLETPFELREIRGAFVYVKGSPEDASPSRVPVAAPGERI